MSGVTIPRSFEAFLGRSSSVATTSVLKHGERAVPAARRAPAVRRLYEPGPAEVWRITYAETSFTSVGGSIYPINLSGAPARVVGNGEAVGVSGRGFILPENQLWEVSFNAFLASAAAAGFRVEWSVGSSFFPSAGFMRDAATCEGAVSATPARGSATYLAQGSYQEAGFRIPDATPLLVDEVRIEVVAKRVA
jgi:hypothetical protein